MSQLSHYLRATRRCEDIAKESAQPGLNPDLSPLTGDRPSAFLSVIFCFDLWSEKVGKRKIMCVHALSSMPLEVGCS